jgi:hypothetical protein
MEQARNVQGNNMNLYTISEHIEARTYLVDLDVDKEQY